MTKTGTLRFFAALLVSAMALPGCSKGDGSADKRPQKPVVEQADVTAAPEADEAAEDEVQEGGAAVPSSTEKNIALKLGNQLMMEGKLEEAEAKYRIAAAAGSAEADRMLGKVRMELDARTRFKAAKEKIGLGDYEGAKADLRGIPAASSLRDMANKLDESIDERRNALDRALEDNLKQGLDEAEGEAAAEGAAAAGGEAAEGQDGNEP